MADTLSPAGANSGAEGSFVSSGYDANIARTVALQATLYDNIPSDLRSRPQWVVWRYEHARNQAKLTKVPYNPLTNKHASTTNADTWCDFTTSVEAVRTGWDGVGFVLTDSDPFCFVDFDLPKDDRGQPLDRPDILARHVEWIRELNSYTEISPGGGVHVIVKGRVPQGRKRDFVEVYFSGRFMTMTGNVWTPQ